MVTVLIAGGGTGGHVFPMLAVGQAILALEPRASVFYVGTERGIETRAVPQAGGELELLRVLPLRGDGIRGLARGAIAAVRSLTAARALIRKRKPDVVLSVGGYAGGPVALVARAMGVPLAVMEPNSVIGLTNRLLAPIADRAYTAFPEVESRFPRRRLRRFGVPLRRAFTPSPYAPRADQCRILVLGGSLGAKALNEAMPSALAALARQHPEVHVLHQAGRGNAQATLARYHEHGVAGSATVVDFIDDVGVEIDRADLIVSRSGAGALSEICAIGRASLLVPYPFAVDQHQLRNARSLQQAGASVVLPQPELTEARLFEELRGLVSAPERRAQLAANARGLGRPEAARTIAEDLLSLARKRRD